MTRKLRVGLLTCAGIAALAVSAPAFAAFMPQLAVSAAATGGTLIHYSQPSGDDAALKRSTSFNDVQLRQYWEDDVANRLAYKFNLDCVYKPPVTTPAAAPPAAPGRRAGM